jgi:hypothetical protein
MNPPLQSEKNLLTCYRRELLEIGRADDMDFSRIVKVKQHDQQRNNARDGVGQREMATDFVDDPEVPPLE